MGGAVEADQWLPVYASLRPSAVFGLAAAVTCCAFALIDLTDGIVDSPD
jgi:hypothetical protein